MVKFCSSCGGKMQRSIPQDDDRIRDNCPDCGHIHYDNPVLVTGCLLTHKNKIQLVKRAIEPEKGRWTLPAGYMENGESAEDAAVREAWEEARARVISQGLYFVYSLPQLNQVYLIYRGELTGFHVGDAGHESLSVGLFEEQEIPWEDLAFRDLVKPIVETYFSDTANGSYPVRNLCLDNLEIYDR
jgi:ADP-ribose pyrophosphatase YjhB (NUDIX family)